MLEESPTDLRRSVMMFIITLLCVYVVFGFQWMNGNPLTDGEVAIGSAKFAFTLMLILLAHEMGHYIVARRHGFSLSLPLFIPFPFAFGTLGAVIQLKSFPKSRSALLEMGAAGPIAGFVVSIIAAFIGMPKTKNYAQVNLEIPVEPLNMSMTAGNAAVGQADLYGVGSIAVPQPPPLEPAEALDIGVMDQILLVLLWPLEQLTNLLEYVGALPSLEGPGVPLMILADPLLLQVIGKVQLGVALSPFAELDPIAFAAWVGCMLTAINMLPIGQLDGGHICNALFPKHAKSISKIGLGLLLLGGLIWPGWLVWGVLLWFMGAWQGLLMSNKTGLTHRAYLVALMAGCCFIFSFMYKPINLALIPFDDIIWKVDSE